MENMFKKYLIESELASNQPVSGDSIVFTINETLDIETDVIDHRDGSIIIDIDEITESILEDCGCILEQTFVAGRDFDIVPDSEYHGYVMGDETIHDPDGFNKIGYGIYKKEKDNIYRRVGDVIDPLTGKYFGPYPAKGANAVDAFRSSVDALDHLDEFVPGPLRSGTDTSGPKTGMSSNPDTMYTNTPTAGSSPELKIGSTSKGGEQQIAGPSTASSDLDTEMFSGNTGQNLQKLAGIKTPIVPQKPTTTLPLPKQKPTSNLASKPTKAEYSVTGKLPQATKANIPTGTVNPNLLAGLKGPAAKPIAQPSISSGIGTIKPPPNIAKAKGPNTAGGSMPYLRESAIIRTENVFYDVYPLAGKWRAVCKRKNQRAFDLGLFASRSAAVVACRRHFKASGTAQTTEEIEDLKRLSGLLFEATKEKTDIEKIQDADLSQKTDAALEEEDTLEEAKYKGREVKLGKPTRGDVAKYKVYVRDPKTGNIKKVNFGDKNMEIKRDDPKRRKSFRARHNCSQKKDRTTAGYWSCRLWSSKPVSKIVKE